MLSKLKTLAALCGAFFIALGIAFLKGRGEGKRHMEAEQQRKRDALQSHYDQIDAGPVDVGGAYDSLRKRSGGR
jgi:hypothetical protein